MHIAYPVDIGFFFLDTVSQLVIPKMTFGNLKNSLETRSKHEKTYIDLGSVFVICCLLNLGVILKARVDKSITKIERPATTFG